MSRIRWFSTVSVLFARRKPLTLSNSTLKSNTVESKDPILPKTWKEPTHQRVAFNLQKLKQLSGYEKIELLRDYLLTKSPKEACFVYQTLVQNGISNRLEYKDHHNLFRLLLARPVENREMITLIKTELQVNGYVPTEYFLNEYCLCCVAWGNVQAAIETIEWMIQSNITISAHTWDSLFKYYNQLNDLEGWNDGIGLWTKMKTVRPLIRPNATTYLYVIELMSKVGDMTSARTVYLDALDNVSRLESIHCKRMKLDQDSQWRSEYQVKLFNSFLNGLVLNCDGAIDSVDKEYRDFVVEGYLMGSKQGSNTFHILFKMCSKWDHKVLARTYFEEMDGLSISPDYLHFSRMIELSSTEEQIEELYKEAKTVLNLSVGGAKRQAIDSSYLVSIVKWNTSKAWEIFQEIRERRKPLQFVYLTLQDTFEKQNVPLEWLQKLKEYQSIDYNK